MLAALSLNGSYLAPLVVFFFVVFVHELGHFLAAKLVGVYAPRFSIGFGPALWRKKLGETEYILAAFPLGGYVRMASREDETMAMLEGGKEEPVALEPGAVGDAVAVAAGEPRPKNWDENAIAPFGPLPVPEHRWFESKPLPARLFIMLAGVTMNMLLALVILVGLAYRNGRPDFSKAIVQEVATGKPAERAGLRAGDTLIAINGTPLGNAANVSERIRASSNDSVTMTYRRAGAEHTVTVGTELLTGPDSTGKPSHYKGVGVFVAGGRIPIGFAESVREGWDDTWGMAGMILVTLKNLVVGKESVRNLGGVIAIATTSYQAARAGIDALLATIALISANLAIINLLPIPILDGGQIVVNVIESARRKPFSLRTRENILKTGLAAIALLFVLVLFNDLRRLIVGS